MLLEALLYITARSNGFTAALNSCAGGGNADAQAQSATATVGRYGLNQFGVEALVVPCSMVCAMNLGESGLEVTL